MSNVDERPATAEEELRKRLLDAEDRCERAQNVLLRYRGLFEWAPDSYLVTDAAGIILECNRQAARLFGRQSSLLVGKPLPFFFSRDDRPGFYDRLARLRGVEGSSQEWEARLDPQPGRPEFVAVTAAGYVDAEGRPGGLRWLIRDVTARKAAERDLRTEKAFAESLIDAAQAVVLLADGDGRLLRVNAYLEALTGYGRNRLLGNGWLVRLLDPTDQDEALALFRRAGRGGEKVHAIFPVRTREGGTRLIAWAAHPARGPDGLPTGALAVGHDITELQEAQQKVVRLERLAAIGETAAGLAHESRNALQRGQACLERLQWRLQDNPEALALAQRATAAQDDLIRLYESVREFAAPLRVDPTPCDPAEVWRRAWDDVRGLAADRDAVLEEVPPPVEDRACRADRLLLTQVFRNLFENALAACPDPARVTVACGPAGGRDALKISVRDNGPGLTPEQRRRMFETFFTTKARGTGLGLAIVKRIVEAHGGEVGVGDGPGGAEIILTLPREPR